MGTGRKSTSTKSRNRNSSIQTVSSTDLAKIIRDYSKSNYYYGEHSYSFDKGPNATQEQRQSLSAWSGTSNACRYIRAAGRGETVDSQYQTDFQNIEKFISQNPTQFKDITLFRGVPADRYYDEMKNWKVGTIINQRGSSSWSSDAKVATGFTDSHPSAKHKANILFVEPRGSVRARSIVSHSQYASESEALQSATTSQKITKIVKGKLNSHDKYETWVVEVKEVFKKK